MLAQTSVNVLEQPAYAHQGNNTNEKHNILVKVARIGFSKKDSSAARLFILFSQCAYVTMAHAVLASNVLNLA